MGIVDPKDEESLALQFLISPLVDLGSQRVHGTIELHNQSSFQTSKINNPMPDRVLSSEFVAIESPIPEPRP